MSWLRLAVATVLVLAFAAASGEEPLVVERTPQAPSLPTDLTFRRHLGFYLHLDNGIGAIRSSGSGGWVKSGVASGRLGIAIGGAISENVILAGRAWDVVRVQGRANTDISLTGFGPEITVYLMPANIFLSVAPSRTFFELDGRTYEGYGVLGGIGKEWWIGAHWGLGVSGQGFMSGNSSAGTAWTFGGRIALSGTYN